MATNLVQLINKELGDYFYTFTRNKQLKII
jgi:hypothetical protein